MNESGLSVRLATTAAEIDLAQALRYRVFSQDFGATGEGFDPDRQRESDRFDAHCDHFIVWSGGEAVATLRLMGPQGAAAAGAYYTATEFDLTALLAHSNHVAEIGRACIVPQWRGGAVMGLLWQAVAELCLARGYEYLVGTASLPAQAAMNVLPVAEVLLAEFAAEAAIAPISHQNSLARSGALDRRTAMLQVPALLKSYLRHGARLGQGVYWDSAFKTLDVCVVFEASTFLKSKVTRPQ